MREEYVGPAAVENCDGGGGHVNVEGMSGVKCNESRGTAHASSKRGIPVSGRMRGILVNSPTKREESVPPRMRDPWSEVVRGSLRENMDSSRRFCDTRLLKKLGIPFHEAHGGCRPMAPSYPTVQAKMLVALRCSYSRNT